MRRSTIFMALAMVAAVLAATTVYSALKSREAQIRRAMVSSRKIVVAARNLPLGAKIAASELKLARWPSNALPPGVFTDPEAVVGRYVKTPLVAEEPIVAKKLVSPHHAGGLLPLLIPPGMRAVSMPVDEVSDVAGFVMPQTHVDVLVAMNANRTGAALSKIVVQNVEVLAVAQEMTKQGDKPQVVKVVTLLVTPRQAETLTLASREGTLRLAIRGYSDTRIASVAGVNVATMLGASGAGFSQAQTDASGRQNDPFTSAAPSADAAPSARRPKGPSVEVLRDGRSAQSVSFASAGTLAESASPKLTQTFADPPAAASELVAAAEPSPGALETPADRQTKEPEVGHAGHKEAAYAPLPKTIDVP